MNSLTTKLNSFGLSRAFSLLHQRHGAYKSAVSLDTLYPQSSLRLTTPSKVDSSMSDKFSGFIPMEELDITYSKSSGPGGQNVNKINTKVDLRFHLQSAKWISEELKSKLLEKYKTKLTKEGYIVFKSDLTRSQQLNLADCLNKLRQCINQATYVAPPPTEETVERIRKRHEKANRERLMEKRFRSDTKAARREPTGYDL